MIDQNKDNNLTHLNFSILFAIYNRGGLEIRSVPYCYKKDQIPSLKTTQLVFFDDFHIKQLIRLSTTSHKNEYKFFFQDMNKGKWMWKEVFMTQTINQRGQPLSTNKRDNFSWCS